MNTKDFYSIECTVDNQGKQYENIKNWLIKNDRTRIITFLNPHVFNYAAKDEVVYEVLNRSDINSIDGVGIKLGFLFKNFKYYTRTIMTYLFEEVLYSSEIPKTKAVLIGTSEQEVSRMAESINRISSGIEIQAYYHGFYALDYYISEIEKPGAAGLILIGMGTPKSEHLIRGLSDLKRNLILWHIGGGTIKCFANTKRRSPVWLSMIGFEWVHRVFFEPCLMNRYILGIPLFLVNIFRIKRYRKKEL